MVSACLAAPPASPPRPAPVPVPPCEAVWIEARAPRGPHPPALVDLAVAVAGRVCYRDWLSGRAQLTGWLGELCRLDPGGLGPAPVEVELTLGSPPVSRWTAAPPLARVHMRCSPPEPD